MCVCHMLLLLAVMMDGSADNGRVDTTMSVSGVPTPPSSMDMQCPMAENWCYTQVRMEMSRDLGIS